MKWTKLKLNICVPHERMTKKLYFEQLLKHIFTQIERNLDFRLRVCGLDYSGSENGETLSSCNYNFGDALTSENVPL